MSGADSATVYIASFAALISAISAVFSYVSMNKSQKHFDQNKLDLFVSKSCKHYDDCYVALNDFVVRFSTTADDNIEKMMARDSIMYILNVIQTDLDPSKLITSDISKASSDLDLTVSDATYQKDIHIITLCLDDIKSQISSIKSDLHSLEITNY